MSIWRWADGIDDVSPTDRVSLGEGNTPVVRSRRIGPSVGLENLYFKLDGCNPTGSFKDRFAVTAVSHMRAAGQTRCVATSSGNTGAALAAYCAAAGIACHIAIVETAPLGKLKQMLAYGANIFRVRGFGIDGGVSDQVFRTLLSLAERPDTALQISAFRYSPLGMSGMRTIAFELAEQLPQLDHVFTQAGGGGMTLAVAQGFQWLAARGRANSAGVPRLECVQPEGNNTIAGPLRSGADVGRDVTCTTLISGLQVPTVIDANAAIPACRATGGTGHVVRDVDVWALQKRLAREEGIFCEPAAAVSVAGAVQAAREGWIQPSAVVACLISGIGFKDAAAMDRMTSDVECPLIGAEEVEGLIGGN